jgi:hypothetical protein
VGAQEFTLGAGGNWGFGQAGGVVVARTKGLDLGFLRFLTIFSNFQQLFRPPPAYLVEIYVKIGKGGLENDNSDSSCLAHFNVYSQLKITSF